MVFKSILGTTCACLLSVAATSTMASVVYTYTGNSFEQFTTTSSYDNTMSVSVTFELASALDSNFLGYVAPLNYSMFDGINTNTNINSSNQFLFTTDATGTITSWNIWTVSASASGAELFRISTHYDGIPGGADDFDGGINGTVLDEAFAEARADGWSSAVVPVPAAAWLFGTGLIGLIGVARRKKA